MEFVSANKELANEDNNLTILPLKVLQTIRDPYEALLVQPQGVMQATEHHR